MLRNYYLFGTQDASSCPYNKIASTVETLCSFIYSPDSVRFNIHLGTTAPPDEVYKVKPLVHEINDMWRMTKAHINFGLALKWSLVFGCMLFKTIWVKGLPRPYLVEPHQFGVLREDIIELSDQEAFVHCYTTTRSQLESDLKDQPSKLAKIMPQVGRGPDDSTIYPDGVSRLMLSQGISLTQGSGPGGAVQGGLTGGTRVIYEYAPQVEQELVDMYELYVWNDDINDYQMVTMASPNVVIYDRKQPGVAGVPQFEKLAPELNCYNYFWGESFVARLTFLQDWRTDRIFEIRQLLAKQADPPKSFTGFAGIQEEKLLAMRQAGGMVSSSMPGAKMEQFPPTMPANTFTELSEIDRMFDDQAGIGHILQGKGEPGVRSKGQADLMARLGSARPKARAMVVEEAAEGVATLMLRAVQENSKQRFIAETPAATPGTPQERLTFVPAQFTTDFEVRVDAHSSSPIFVEDRKNDAYQLLEAKAIDRETLLDMVDPPGKQALIANLKVIEAKEAEQAKAQAAQEQAKKGDQ